MSLYLENLESASGRPSQPHPSESPITHKPSFGLSLKSILWGCVLAVAVNIGALYSTFINASWMALNISVPISLFAFFLFSWIVNPALGLVHRRLALHRRELAAVFIMAMMAAVVPTEGYIAHMIPKIIGGYYYATPENGWAELIHPDMKS